MQNGVILTADPTSLWLSVSVPAFASFCFFFCFHASLTSANQSSTPLVDSSCPVHTPAVQLLSSFNVASFPASGASFLVLSASGSPPRRIFVTSLHCRFMFSFSQRTFIFAVCISCSSGSYTQMQYCRSWRTGNSFVRTLIYLWIYMCRVLGKALCVMWLAWTQTHHSPAVCVSPGQWPRILWQTGCACTSSPSIY